MISLGRFTCTQGSAFAETLDEKIIRKAPFHSTKTMFVFGLCVRRGQSESDRDSVRRGQKKQNVPRNGMK